MGTVWSEDGQYLSKAIVNTKTMNRNAHRTIRNLTILTDFLLINIGWVLGYLVRYRYDALWEWVGDPIEQYNHSFSSYFGQQTKKQDRPDPLRVLVAHSHYSWFLTIGFPLGLYSLTCQI